MEVPGSSFFHLSSSGKTLSHSISLILVHLLGSGGAIEVAPCSIAVGSDRSLGMEVPGSSFFHLSVDGKSLLHLLHILDLFNVDDALDSSLINLVEPGNIGRWAVEVAASAKGGRDGVLRVKVPPGDLALLTSNLENAGALCLKVVLVRVGVLLHVRVRVRALLPIVSGNINNDVLGSEVVLITVGDGVHASINGKGGWIRGSFRSVVYVRRLALLLRGGVFSLSARRRSSSHFKLVL